DDRGRMLVGLWILALGALAVLSLARGDPSPGAGYHALGRAGGAVGAAAAWPLARVMSVYGAVVVTLGLVAIGGLVLSATPLAAVGRAVKRFFIEEPSDEVTAAPDKTEQRRPRRAALEEATDLAP